MFEAVAGIYGLFAAFGAVVGAFWRTITHQGLVRAIQGAIRYAYYFLLGLTLIQAVWVILLILSLDMLTPPYVIGPESVLAIPLSWLLKSAFSLSTAWALGISYAIVLIFAGIVVAVHFLWLRHHLKVL